MSTYTQSFLVTGGTTGLGYEAAAEIARRYPKALVVIAARKDAKKSAQAINERLGQNNVRFMSLDLADQKNVRAFAKKWTDDQLPPISALLLNAALQFPSRLVYTADGIEATFGITHVGHALLFHLLQPHLADEARVVVTSSDVHDPALKTGMPPPLYPSAEEVAHPTGKLLTMPGRQRYTTAKLCNVLWMYALNNRLRQVQGNKWTVVAFNPGLMPATGLAREAGPFLRFLWHHVMPRIIPLLRAALSPDIHTPKESGTSLAWVAVDESQKTTSGVYYSGREQKKSSTDSYDEAKQEDMWSWTVKNVAADEEERRRFDTLQ